MARDRAEILIVVDRPHWGLDYKTNNLLRRLGQDFRLVKKYQADVTEADLDRADLVQVYYARTLPQESSATPTAPSLF